MSTTLSNGYKNPDTGDRGSSWFADLNFNITRLNSHSHNGSDSERINVKDISKSTATLSSASWGSDLGGGSWKQSVTLPTGFTFDDTLLKFIISGGTYDGAMIHPSVVKTGSNTMDVFVNRNDITVKVIYG